MGSSTEMPGFYSRYMECFIARFELWSEMVATEVREILGTKVTSLKMMVKYLDMYEKRAKQKMCPG